VAIAAPVPIEESVIAETPGSFGEPQIIRKPRTQGRWTGWAFIGPFMAVFTLVFIAPIIYAIWLSLHRTQMIGGTSFVGFANYVQALQDPRFWDGLGRVVLFLLVQVPIMLAIALLMALLIDSRRLYGSNFWRIAIFMPYAVPGVVAALIWGFMYGTRFGLVGNLNDLFGWNLNPLNSNLLLPAIGNIVTWLFVGYNMLIFYSALKVVDSSLYEAAAIDGASQWQIIRHIKIPAIRGALLIAVIFSIIGSFQLFNEPNILQMLSPQRISTHYTPNMFAYNLSFAGQQTNYAAAIAIIMGIITMIIAYIVQLRGMRKDV